MAYLGFHNGEAKFSLGTSAHTKERAKLHFSYGEKQKKICQRGPWPIWPRGKYATDRDTWALVACPQLLVRKSVVQTGDHSVSELEPLTFNHSAINPL